MQSIEVTRSLPLGEIRTEILRGERLTIVVKGEFIIVQGARSNGVSVQLGVFHRPMSVRFLDHIKCWPEPTNSESSDA